LHTWSDFNSII